MFFRFKRNKNIVNVTSQTTDLNWDIAKAITDYVANSSRCQFETEQPTQKCV